MPQKKSTSEHIAAGVVILMAAGISEKILGVLFKIPLYNVLGSIGMGYFNSAYSIFSTFYTVSLTGFPIATAILVSRNCAMKRIRQIRRVFLASLTIFIILGVVGSAVMFFGSDVISHIIDSESDSALCIRAIAPILLIICISSSVRGYFQGHQNMIPTALSEFFDALGKCAFGVILAVYAHKCGYSVEVTAAYAIAGVTLGHLPGMIFLIALKILKKQQYDLSEMGEDSSITSYKSIYRSIIAIAIPITLSSVALGLTANIDTFTIMNCLDAEDGMAQYGDYTTLAVTLFRLPQALIIPLSSALTPALSAAVSMGNSEKNAHLSRSSLKMAAVLSLPCAFGMGVMSYQIIYFLFGRANSTESIQNVAPYLTILAVAVFFMAILTITSSILQSNNFQKKPVISMVCGAVAKLMLNIILVSKFGIIGAPISTVVGYFIMALINMFFVNKLVCRVSVAALFAKPFVSSAVMAVAAVIFCKLISKALTVRFSLIATIIVSIVVYVIMLCLTRAIDYDDIGYISKKGRLSAVLCKLGLIRKKQ
ncbi:MAG: polysaccharide biosynthesis protein [Clostridia bacterium]|nr:polysaccharide biosynthesis protein [Clostridia bacterium]